MSAFEKILSGNLSLDQTLDWIRLGDNVVWQLSDLSDFRPFMQAFVKQAILDGRSLHYIRFASHEPLLKPMDGLTIHHFDPDQGFESFTVAIYNCIAEQGFDAFYVFDCLSELQSAWYTDLMMGNFFRVTCPHLFVLDTVAYFPILRGRHSFDAIAKIRETTQLLLDVHSDAQTLYLHPMKVWKRYSPRMFLPHECTKPATEADDFVLKPLTGGIAMSRYYQLLEDQSSSFADQHFDSLDRFFALAKLEYSQGTFGDNTQNLIIQSTMTKDERMADLLRQYFVPKDYFTVRDRMIGSGAIGGKACGMLLARKIIHRLLPAYKQFHRESHDSYYIASDVFYTYIVENNCWETRVAQRTKEGYFAKSTALQDALLSGEFSFPIREQFRAMLEYMGQAPIIVRSSSFLEDGFGNAFAGKYESVFCANQGRTPEDRLLAFEDAVRKVYASIMDASALEYRARRGLWDKDEQMAVLVQRVSGSYFGPYFMPCVAGVGYSHSAYKWRADMDPAAGMLRVVVGLGTRAVDRTQNDYPRLVNLDHPDTTMMTSVAQKHRFSQRVVDVLDLSTNDLCEVSLGDVLPHMPLWLKKQVLEQDDEAQDALRRLGRPKDVWFVSCQALLENRDFTSTMQDILKTLEKVYENPVDIEYTVNLDETGDFVINLLQCRPLYMGHAGGRLALPTLQSSNTLFDIIDSSMGSSGIRAIDVVVYVDPRGYYEFPHQQKPFVAAAIGKVNQYYKESGKSLLLITPGRVGTSSPELGVPVKFADISGFCGICEVSEKSVGYMPELSYGSHMFQDLVEAEILYGAIWNNEKTLVYQPQMLVDCEDQFGSIVSGAENLKGILSVWEPKGLTLWHDAV
ncbi:MAG: PEP/pyruvate-binding domain-containing protein, partial [Clostridium sp.]|nr:PEP/pyruvate-binding domain-containing protein [Clostridium sp.]